MAVIIPVNKMEHAQDAMPTFSAFSRIVEKQSYLERLQAIFSGCCCCCLPDVALIETESSFDIVYDRSSSRVRMVSNNAWPLFSSLRGDSLSIDAIVQPSSLETMQFGSRNRLYRVEVIPKQSLQIPALAFYKEDKKTHTVCLRIYPQIEQIFTGHPSLRGHQLAFLLTNNQQQVVKADALFWTKLGYLTTDRSMSLKNVIVFSDQSRLEAFLSEKFKESESVLRSLPVSFIRYDGKFEPGVINRTWFSPHELCVAFPMADRSLEKFIKGEAILPKELQDDRAFTLQQLFLDIQEELGFLEGIYCFGLHIEVSFQHKGDKSVIIGSKVLLRQVIGHTILQHFLEMGRGEILHIEVSEDENICIGFSSSRTPSSFLSSELIHGFKGRFFEVSEGECLALVRETMQGVLFSQSSLTTLLSTLQFSRDWTNRVSHEETVTASPTFSVRENPLVFTSRSVLYAEDSPMAAKLVVRFLNELKHSVIHVKSGEEALAALRADPHKYDIGIFDIQMPGGNGDDAVKQAIKEGFDLPIVALSANTTPEDKAHYFACGMRAVFAKPIDKETLKNLVAEYSRSPVDIGLEEELIGHK